jgi:hypothetical protein
MTGLSVNLIIQYTLVFILLAGAVAYIIWKLVHIRKNGGASSCCGCSLSDSCGKKRDAKPRGNAAAKTSAPDDCDDKKDCCCH